jgi:hypothetical protein
MIRPQVARQFHHAKGNYGVSGSQDPGEVYAVAGRYPISIVLCAAHDVIRGYRMLTVTATSLLVGLYG